MRAACCSRRRCAASSITGPMSVASSPGSPIRARAWRRPASRARAARCRPAGTGRAAPSSAGRPSGTPNSSTSATTCSGSAEESTSIAFWPPVSAISGTIGPSLAASARLIAQAVVGRAGERDAGDARDRDQRAPRPPAPPGSRIRASSGTPARCSSATALAAISGVCGAGLASTALPTASAAAICPVKIASGKFQGLIATNTPRPCRARRLLSPVGPGSSRGAAPAPAPRSRSSAGSRPPRAPRRPHRAGSCRPRARTRRSARPRSPRTDRRRAAGRPRARPTACAPSRRKPRLRPPDGRRDRLRRRPRSRCRPRSRDRPDR